MGASPGGGFSERSLNGLTSCHHKRGGYGVMICFGKNLTVPFPGKIGRCQVNYKITRKFFKQSAGCIDKEWQENNSEVNHDQEFLVRYFVIFKSFAEAELKNFSHHRRQGSKEEIE